MYWKWSELTYRLGYLRGASLSTLALQQSRYSHTYEMWPESYSESSPYCCLARYLAKDDGIGLNSSNPLRPAAAQPETARTPTLLRLHPLRLREQFGRRSTGDVVVLALHYRFSAVRRWCLVRCCCCFCRNHSLYVRPPEVGSSGGVFG